MTADEYAEYQSRVNTSRRKWVQSERARRANLYDELVEALRSANRHLKAELAAHTESEVKRLPYLSEILTSVRRSDAILAKCEKEG